MRATKPAEPKVAGKAPVEAAAVTVAKVAATAAKEASVVEGGAAAKAVYLPY